MKRVLSLVLVLVITVTMFCVISGPTAQGETLWGIDVSQWQGSVDWTQVKAAGVDFVILRGWCYGKDPNFETYYAGAKAAGIPVGVYCYTYGLTETAIVSEMDSLINNCLTGKQFEFPIYVDMECTSYQGNSSWVNGYDTNTKAQNAALMDAACSSLEEAGYFAGMYTYTSFIESYLDVSELKTKYTMWIADYRTSCGYDGPYDMWQYSDKGSVSGISGNVDMNYCYLNFEPIIKSIGLNGYEPSTTYPYETDDGSLMLYDGEYSSTISSSFSTTYAVSTDQKTQGNKSLKMICTSPNAQNSSTKIGGMVHHKFTQKADLSAYDTIAFDIYLPVKMEGSHGFQVNFNTSGQDGFNKLVPLNDKGPGWVKFEILKSEIPAAVSGADWSNINNLRLTWFNYSDVTDTTTFYIDNIRAYNAPLAVDEAVEAVKDLINALPEPNAIALGHETAVREAQTAFTNLKDDQKAAVGDDLVGKLTDCLKTLENAINNRQVIDRVIQAIENLPLPADVNKEHGAQIESVCNLFQQLTQEQQTEVTNHQKLADVLAAYESLSTPVYGDVDLNGFVAAADALEVLKSVVGRATLTEQQILNGDVDGNRIISAADALEILKKVVGKIETFPVELA